ncbi:Bax inhibitor-1/YccA family protein [Carboxylicivirga sp. N1Y90]|uniref:Bax inhibitor-1/YccA family protein n=1 Tax=Carboxylicivirga fragile TaxID=3417571 RepID=UPI003D358F41|nr:Bax inhibitor-1/YccA family protein [Marinilabiliaceae bacterium N1Y90]
MALYKSSNPALNSKIFKSASITDNTADVMTINGTVNKTALLALLAFAAAVFTWDIFMVNQDIASVQPYIFGGFILGFITAIIIIFKKTLAPYLAPLYCLFEGLALGGISAMMEMSYPGIVLQAIVLTFGILFGLLIIYRLGIIKATENFKLMVTSATAGIAFLYLVSFIGGFFGFNLPFLHDNSPLSIGISLVIVAIAALNLVMDFDFIEEGAAAKAPKYMEWYGAFGLMVTLIWLYLEILRLLSKLRSR